jgi:tetratricopeptide (TPR) repeat protein
VEGWLDASPGDPTAQILAARLDQAEKNPGSAERRLLGVLRAHPDRLEAYELLGSLYVTEAQGSAALEKYRALAARVPDADGPATMVGILLDGQGDRAGAIAQYQSILARSPRAAVAANNLAWLLAEDGRLDDARPLAQVAAETLRGRPEPLDTMGWISLKAHRATEALASFRRAVDLAPENHLYQEHLQAARLELSKQ